MRKIICLAIFAGFSAVGLTAQDMYRGFAFDQDGIGRQYVDNGVGFSVRCLKD